MARKKYEYIIDFFEIVDNVPTHRYTTVVSRPSLFKHTINDYFSSCSDVDVEISTTKGTGFASVVVKLDEEYALFHVALYRKIKD